MALNREDSRLINKISTLSGVTPTIPSSNDHTDGTWLNTDLYVGELFHNSLDKKSYVRHLDNIYELAYIKDLNAFAVSSNFLPLSGGTMVDFSKIAWSAQTYVQGGDNRLILRGGSNGIEQFSTGNINIDAIGAILSLGTSSTQTQLNSPITYAKDFSVQNGFSFLSGTTRLQDLFLLKTESLSGDYLPLSGGTLSGNLNTGGNNINTQGGNVVLGGGVVDMRSGSQFRSDVNAFNDLPTSSGRLVNDTLINPYTASTLSNINLRLLTTDFNNYSANTLTSINNKVTKGGDTGSLVIGTNNATTLNFITNNGIRQQIDSSGNFIFSGTTTLVSLNDLRILDNNGTSYFVALDSTVNNQLRIANGFTSVQYQTSNHSFGSANNTAINLFGSSSLNALRARGTTLDVGTGFTNIYIPAILNLSATTTGNTASRMVETDIDGNIQGIEDIVPLQIFGYNTQQNLSNNNNWVKGVYTGNTTASTATTLTGTYQGQFYDDTNWFYWMKENNVPIRLPKGSIIPRGLLINNNVINSSGSGITIFSSYNLSPFTLKFDGDEIDTEYYGKTIDVSASKRLRVFFNGQLVYNNENDGQYFGGNNINWKLNVKHIRINSSGTTYHTGIFSIVNYGTYQNHVMNTTLTGNTFSDSINIRLEANDTSGNFANNQIQLTKIKYNPFI